MKNIQPGLKENQQEGQQPISKGAALQKKKKFKRNSATSTPTPKLILKSTANKAVLN